jgi:sulfonate transport system substrate-binding protein
MMDGPRSGLFEAGFHLRENTMGIINRVVVAAGLWSPAAQAQDKTLRIGFQKYGTLVILKERGALDKRLKSEGYTVTWTEFPGGPQLLEALNVGAIDFGSTGEAPPIFAQAAGAPLLYVGHEPAAPKGEALIVPKDSKINSIPDLKGKRVALNKGSNVHYLLVRALEANGLSLSDIESVFLPPADARAAFESGKVDAWVIWDPFLAAAQAATGARTLTDGTGLADNYQFYLASRAFVTDRGDAVKAILEELNTVDQWASANTGDAAKALAPGVGIPATILKTSLDRQSYGIQPITPDIVEAQQKIADTFHKLGLLPKPITIRDAVWTPSS